MREIGSLEAVLTKPDKYADKVVWIPTLQMLEVAHPDNPRTHSEDGDVAEIFKSLLAFGWGDFGITFNPHTGKQTGGHGRVLAARLGMQHDDDWFEQAWELFLKGHQDRKGLAEYHQERYCPQYWEHVPVIITTLTDTDQRALMIRLNNTQPDGQDDPAKMAALLSQLGKDETELAGWDATAAKSFTAAFLIKAAEIEEEIEAEEREESGYNYDAGLPGTDAVDREHSQRFEREDAVDYGDDDDPWNVTAEEESGPVTVTTADGETMEVASLPETKDGVEPGVFKHSGGHYSETRTILYVSKEDNENWKIWSKLFADVFGVNKVGEIAKIWRSQATFAAMRWVLENHPEASQAYAEYLEEKNGDSESTAA